MNFSNYQTEIKLGLLFALVALALPDLASAQQGVDFGAGQNSFATGELKEAPGFITAIAYVAGTIFAFAGILKLKAHSENPGQTPLSHGLGRLCGGGALLALPTITSLIQGTMAIGIGTTNGATAQTLLPSLQ